MGRPAIPLELRRDTVIRVRSSTAKLLRSFQKDDYDDAIMHLWKKYLLVKQNEREATKKVQP